MLVFKVPFDSVFIYMVFVDKIEAKRINYVVQYKREEWRKKARQTLSQNQINENSSV